MPNDSRIRAVAPAGFLRLPDSAEQSEEVFFPVVGDRQAGINQRHGEHCW